MKYACLVLCTGLLLSTVGCDTTTSVEESNESGSDNETVALAVSSLVASDASGLVEQVNDAYLIATSGNVDALGDEAAAKYGDVEKEYDADTGTWTVSLSRHRMSEDGLREATLSRVYEVQFVNDGGNPQQYLVTDQDTASTIHFTIVDGSGTFSGPFVEAEHTGVTGTWVITGVDTEEITINGTYGRSGIHTVTRGDATRTLEYSFALTVDDLVGPRESRGDVTEKISGTLTGVYEGVGTFSRGDTYQEKDLERTVVIDIAGGEMTVTVNGEPYEGDLRSGMLRLPR